MLTRGQELHKIILDELKIEKLISEMGGAEKYDKIPTLFEVDHQYLTIAYLNQNGVRMYDLSNNKIYWDLPHFDLPLCAASSPDGEKLVIGYASNMIRVFDIMNKCLHQWSRENDDHFPSNFLNRYNRLIGSTPLSNNKFMFYTNYTYCILDLNKALP